MNINDMIEVLSVKRSKELSGLTSMSITTTVKMNHENMIIEERKMLFDYFKRPVKTTIIPIEKVIGITKHGVVDTVNAMLSTLLIVISLLVPSGGLIIFIVGVAFMFISRGYNYHIELNTGEHATIQTNRNEPESQFNDLYKRVHGIQTSTKG